MIVTIDATMPFEKQDLTIADLIAQDEADFGYRLLVV